MDGLDKAFELAAHVEWQGEQAERMHGSLRFPFDQGTALFNLDISDGCLAFQVDKTNG